MHPNHKILFEPVKLGPVTTRNRFYQVPHGPGAGNFPQVDVGIKGARAEGGWGVVCCEASTIHPSSDFKFLGMHRLWNDRHIGDNAIVADEIHRHGALAGIELAHFGLIAFNHNTRTPILAPSREVAVGPSESFIVQALAMDRKDINALLAWQRAAALRAKKAGFDIVYVYAAHQQSIVMNFLSPRHNRRTDEYGGSLENRARLLQQMIEVTKDAVGDQCAVAVRLSVDELMGMDGITADREGRQIVEMFAELPDLWDVCVSDWSHDSRSSRFAPEGWQEEYVSFVKQCTTKPVVGVGRFTSPDTMASQIRRGVLDLIGAARPSIADPFLPRKIQEGRSEDIRECIGCNYCIKTMNIGLVSSCTQNPTMGEEWRFGWHPEHIQPARSQARVLIVGSGPAGLEATRALAQRGYEVTLAEASSDLGGRVRREAALPGLREWGRVADWRTSQILKSPRVTIFRENSLTAREIFELEYDHVVIATGSKWRRDGIGLSNRRVLDVDPAASILTPDDLMAGRFPGRGPVIVFDDDHYYIGGVLAELLRDRGLEVQLVTPAETVSKYTRASLESADVVARLRKLGVRFAVHKNIVRIGPNQVTLQCLLSGETIACEAAAVVLVTMRDPVDYLYRELAGDARRLSDGGIRSVSIMGDARTPDTIAAAVFDGHRYAREFDGQPIDVAALPPSTRALY